MFICVFMRMCQEGVHSRKGAEERKGRRYFLMWGVGEGKVGTLLWGGERVLLYDDCNSVDAPDAVVPASLFMKH